MQRRPIDPRIPAVITIAVADPSVGAERTRAYRARLKETGADRAERPPCLLCGRPILLAKIDPESARGRSRTGRALCAPCWRKSDEGRAAERTRNQARQRGKNPSTQRKPAEPEGPLSEAGHGTDPDVQAASASRQR